jgi:hypothetical protein
MGDTYLIYAQRFDVVPQPLSSANSNSAGGDKWDATTGMYILQRAHRRSGLRIGDVIPLTIVYMPIQLVPRFGQHADPRLTPQNSLELSNEFFLNKYSDKDTYQVLHVY